MGQGVGAMPAAWPCCQAQSAAARSVSVKAGHRRWRLPAGHRRVEQAHLHVLPAVQVLAGGAEHGLAVGGHGEFARQVEQLAGLRLGSRSACNWRRWRAARLPVSAAISRKNTRVSTSSSRWMLNEKFGGMNRKS
jgi:hypothetical protein